jgi:hypothetical protein
MLCCSTTCMRDVGAVGEGGAVIIPIVVAGRAQLLLESLAGSGGRAFLGAAWEDAEEEGAALAVRR